MKKIFLRGRDFSTIFLTLLLILTCGIFMNLKIIADDIPRKKAPGSSTIYIPSGKYLKYATFGYSSLLADLIYLWAIQYFSNYTIPERFESLDHVFSIIAELDPRYLDPYEIGALIAVYDAKDLDIAYRILDRGLEKNPDQWIFPFQAGHYAQMLLKDYQTAQKYYKKTMEIEGAPAMAIRLYANAAFRLMDLKTSWESWMEIYQTAEDERIKKIASNHLFQVKASADTQILQEAVEKYEEKFGRKPLNLAQLVKADFLPAIPKDLDGNEYTYDSQTGEVKTSIKWWKR